MINKKITEREYGKAYPYTIDNVVIKIADRYPNAVYIEDESGNKYAVNGNAHVYFTNINKDPKYKGYTTKILKDGESDTLILLEGFKMYSHKQYLKYLRRFWLCYFLLIAVTVLSLFVALNCKHLNWLAWLSFFYCLVNLIAATFECYKLWRSK